MSHYIEMLVTLGFLGGLMWGMMKFLLRDISLEISLIKKDLSEFKTEIRQDMSEFRKEQQLTNARIDHLYQICIEMLKDRK